MKKIKVYLGIPSNGDRIDAQNYFLRRIEKKYGDKIEFVYPEIYVGRIFHDFARNAYVEQFLKSDCDILWFLDADIVPPEHVLDLITEHGDKWELAGAPYPVWMSAAGYEGQQVAYTVYKVRESDDTMQYSPIPESGTDFVDGIATGCLFIRRKVIEQLNKPYFEFKFNPETRDMTEGEDLGFCNKVRKLGFKFFIDFGMVCHHFKKVSLLDVSNYVETQKNQIIENCDRVIRQAIAKEHMKRMSQAPKPKSRLILPNT